jgi:predicted GH43/DUF377 family glycosyl hydrolase
MTHGVGPIREYSIGAVLLDLEDPSKLIGALKQPLLVSLAEEREGYVPNVVYSCGALLQGNTLIFALRVQRSENPICLYRFPSPDEPT